MQKLVTTLFLVYFALLAAVGAWLTIEPAAILEMTDSKLAVTHVSEMVIRLGALGMLLAAALNLVCALRAELRPLLHTLILAYLTAIILSHGAPAFGRSAGMWIVVLFYALPLFIRLGLNLSQQAATRSKPAPSQPQNKGTARTRSAQPARASNKRSQGEAAAVVRTGKEREAEVKWFNPNKGFGFLVTADGEEIFVHFKAVKNGGRRSLRQGQKVLFTTRDTDRGEQADSVTILE